MFSDYMMWIFEVFDGHDHTCLLSQLHNIAFRYSINLDANLYPSVRNFRAKMGQDYDDRTGNPSVLEVLCALAVECEDKIMHNDDYGNRTAQWFWMMLYNLGVNIYDDEHYTDIIAEKVEEKVDIFLDRAYDFNGNGNIFCCKKPYYDMRIAPLWEQLNWYLVENYSKEFKLDW